MVGGAGAWLVCCHSAQPRARFLNPMQASQGDPGAGEGLCCPKSVCACGHLALGMLLAGCWEAASDDDARFTVWESC